MRQGLDHIDTPEAARATLNRLSYNKCFFHLRAAADGGRGQGGAVKHVWDRRMLDSTRYVTLYCCGLYFDAVPRQPCGDGKDKASPGARARNRWPGGQGRG